MFLSLARLGFEESVSRGLPYPLRLDFPGFLRARSLPAHISVDVAEKGVFQAPFRLAFSEGNLGFKNQTCV
jgi:hypothetical protein